MPENGFTQEEMQAIIAWVKRHNWECVSCGEKKWILYKTRPGVIIPESIAEMQKVDFVRVALIACRNCHMVRMYLADKILAGGEDG